MHWRRRGIALMRHPCWVSASRICSRHQRHQRQHRVTIRHYNWPRESSKSTRAVPGHLPLCLFFHLSTENEREGSEAMLITATRTLLASRAEKWPDLKRKQCQGSRRRTWSRRRPFAAQNLRAKPITANHSRNGKLKFSCRTRIWGGGRRGGLCFCWPAPLRALHDIRYHCVSVKPMQLAPFPARTTNTIRPFPSALSSVAHSQTHEPTSPPMSPDIP